MSGEISVPPQTSVTVNLTQEGGRLVLQVDGFPGAAVRLEHDPATGVTYEIVRGDLVRVREGSLVDVVTGDRVEAVGGSTLVRTGGDHFLMTNGISHTNPREQEEVEVVKRMEHMVVPFMDLGTQRNVEYKRELDAVGFEEAQRRLLQRSLPCSCPDCKT